MGAEQILGMFHEGLKSNLHKILWSAVKNCTVHCTVLYCTLQWPSQVDGPAGGVCPEWGLPKGGLPRGGKIWPSVTVDLTIQLLSKTGCTVIQTRVAHYMYLFTYIDVRI